MEENEISKKIKKTVCNLNYNNLCQNIIWYCGALDYPNQVAENYNDCVSWEFDFITQNSKYNYLREIIYEPAKLIQEETKPVIMTTIKQEVKQELKSEVFDINKLAYAVAMQETKNCTLGYWVTHNNCFWIKHWNTVPCPWVPKLEMCKFNSPEESYEAFKIIWQKWYKWMPNLEKAERWTWKDRASIWLANVNYFYNN